MFAKEYKYYEEYLNIWYLNIGCEEIWKDKSQSILPISNKAVLDTEQLIVMLAKKNDLLILRRNIPSIVLIGLNNLGIECCETYIVENNDSVFMSKLILKDQELIDKLKQMKVNNAKVRLIPFGVTIYDEQISNITGIEVFGCGAEISAFLNNKINALHLINSLNIPYVNHFLCNTFNDEEVISFYNMIKSKAVFKEAFGASGKALYIVKTEAEVEKYLRYRKRRKIYSECIIEEWIENAYSFNHQLLFYDDNRISLPLKKQIVNNGVYIGSRFTDNRKAIYPTIMNAQNKLFKYFKDKGIKAGLVSMDLIMTNVSVPCN